MAKLNYAKLKQAKINMAKIKSNIFKPWFSLI